LRRVTQRYQWRMVSRNLGLWIPSSASLAHCSPSARTARGSAAPPREGHAEVVVLRTRRPLDLRHKVWRRHRAGGCL